MYGSHSRFTSQRHIERLPYPSNCHYPRQGNECKQLAHSCYSQISAENMCRFGQVSYIVSLPRFDGHTSIYEVLTKGIYKFVMWVAGHTHNNIY